MRWRGRALARCNYVQITITKYSWTFGIREYGVEFMNIAKFMNSGGFTTEFTNLADWPIECHTPYRVSNCNLTLSLLLSALHASYSTFHHSLIRHLKLLKRD